MTFGKHRFRIWRNWLVQDKVNLIELFFLSSLKSIRTVSRVRSVVTAWSHSSMILWQYWTRWIWYPSDLSNTFNMTNKGSSDCKNHPLKTRGKYNYRIVHYVFIVTHLKSTRKELITSENVPNIPLHTSALHTCVAWRESPLNLNLTEKVNVS